MAQPRTRPADTPPLDDRKIITPHTEEPQGSVGSEGGTSPMDSPSRTAVDPHAPDSPVDDAGP
jgi:hypothetical protein